MRILRTIVRLAEVFLVLATPFIMACAMRAAYEFRGYRAYGGEWCIPLIILVMLLLLFRLDDMLRPKRKGGVLKNAHKIK